MRIKINNQPKRRRNSFSINVKDSKIILKNSFEPCSEQETKSWFIKNMPLEEIILSEFKKKKEWI